MVRKQKEVLVERKPSPFHGKGDITVRNLLNGPEELDYKGRVFAHTTVYPGAALGYHVHERESETYYILSGHGMFNDNGHLVLVSAGDVTFTGAGQGHSIEALGEEPVEMIALILYHGENEKEKKDIDKNQKKD
ncbi:MAG: cupin domain-containing protein [Lachnospiraceae bacterium]|nr:cupin domain-containing protein [Lachnospiraceae bacterium]